MKMLAVAILVSFLASGSSFSAQASSSSIYKQRIQQWNSLTKSLQQVPLRQRIVAVNEFFNRLPYKSDSRVWGQEDYWASPAEFLEKGAGDCEDYAIAKYITLRKTGIPEERLRLVYVRHLPQQQAHMVLIVDEHDGKQVVMDNLTSALQPPIRRGDLKPVYAFNDINLWTLDEHFHKKLIGLSSRLSNWVALKNKTRASGIWTSLIQ